MRENKKIEQVTDPSEAKISLGRGNPISKLSEGRLLLMPLVFFMLVFLSFPLLLDIVYAFSEVTFQTVRAPRFIGLHNFSLVLQDGAFWSSLWFSLRFGLLTACGECVFALGLAVFLSPLLQRHDWMMTILILPIMLAPALVGLMYRLVLHEFVGPVPYYMELWFGASPAFLTAGNAFWTLCVIEILQWTPFAFLLFHVAYQAIATDIREAANIDGAGAWKILTRIELPMMKSTLIIAFAIRFIDGFRVFDTIFALIGPGAGSSTMSLSIYIYQSFFRSGQIGQAVAASTLLFLASLLVFYGFSCVTSVLRKRGYVS